MIMSLFTKEVNIFLLLFSLLSNLPLFFGQVQLNLMAPTRDNYYGNQQTIQGLVSHNY